MLWQLNPIMLLDISEVNELHKSSLFMMTDCTKWMHDCHNYNELSDVNCTISEMITKSRPTGKFSSYLNFSKRISIRCLSVCEFHFCSNHGAGTPTVTLQDYSLRCRRASPSINGGGQEDPKWWCFMLSFWRTGFIFGSFAMHKS